MPVRSLELALAVVVLAVAVLETVLGGDAPALLFLLPVLILPLPWRRRIVLWHALVVAVVMFAVEFAGSPEWDSIAAMGALIMLVFALGSWETLRRGLAGLGFLVGLMVMENVVNGEGGDLGFLLIMLGASWLVGRAVRARRLQVEELGALTVRLEREREAVGELAVDAERARVARDLHDAVAGLLNVMVVQATVAEHCLEADPERAAAAVDAVAASGREAARELARMLELLGGASALLEPQPSLSRLDDLVGFARSAGVPVSLSVDGDARSLPAGLELSAYRIVQEALTNVVKHAGGAPTEVHLHYRSSSLDIEVRDAGGASRNGFGGGGGHGLANMRERAALFGGSLLAEPSGSGGYVVRASLPVS